MRLLVLLAIATIGSGEVDVFERPVAPQVEGRTVVELFANRAIRETVSDAGDRLTLAMHDVPYVTMVCVDLRGVPSLFRFIARRQMKEAYADNVARTRKLYADAGLPPPKSLGHTLVLVPDYEGVAAKRVGLHEDFSEGLAIVIAPDGKEVARAPIPSGMKTIEAALRGLHPAAEGRLEKKLPGVAHP